MLAPLKVSIFFKVSGSESQQVQRFQTSHPQTSLKKNHLGKCSTLEAAPRSLAILRKLYALRLSPCSGFCGKAEVRTDTATAALALLAIQLSGLL